MIGFVSPNLQAVVRFRVRGAAQEKVEDVEAIVDTGFNGFLAMPAVVLARLGAQPFNRVLTTLADGNDVVCEVFAVEAEIDGIWRQTEVLQLGRAAVLGMALMETHNLSIEVRDGGAVTIEAL